MNCPKCKKEVEAVPHKEPGAAAFFCCVECGKFLQWVESRVKKGRKKDVSVVE